MVAGPGRPPPDTAWVGVPVGSDGGMPETPNTPAPEEKEPAEGSRETVEEEVERSDGGSGSPPSE